MVGRCLDVIGSEDKLGALMEKAVAAAKAEADPKCLKRILTDKEIFEKTWLDSAKRRRAELGALDVFRAEREIELDGEAREHDWKVANVRPFFGKNRANVRACWKERELRLFVEWEQGPMTLSFAFPDGSDKVERVSVSASGKVSSTVPDVCAKINGNKAEFAIPLASTGWRCLDGGNWKVKVGDPDSLHGFVQMRMIPARQGVFKVEKTYSYWRNATFDEGYPTSNIAKAQQWVHWTNEIGVPDVPRPWGGPQAWGATKSHEPGGSDRYVTILPEKECVFSQGYVAPVSGKMRLTFRARGKGSVRVWSACYHTEPVTKLMSETAKGETFKLTDAWQTYSADFTKTGAPDESVMVRFFAADAPVDIDDAYFNPL